MGCVSNRETEMQNTLEVYQDKRLIFSSTGKWLYPLFDLEEFLKNKNLEPRQLLVKDKIVGKAAALLLVRLKIERLRAGILSELAKIVLDRYKLHYEYGQLVERVLCKTEELLGDIDDPISAYALLLERAGR